MKEGWKILLLEVELFRSCHFRALVHPRPGNSNRYSSRSAGFAPRPTRLDFDMPPLHTTSIALHNDNDKSASSSSSSMSSSAAAAAALAQQQQAQHPSPAAAYHHGSHHRPPPASYSPTKVLSKRWIGIIRILDVCLSGSPVFWEGLMIALQLI